MTRDGFQPCAVDTGDLALSPAERHEKRLVLLALLVHVVDAGLDLLVVFLFLSHLRWGFFICSVGVLLWAWLVSGLYISFGAGAAAGDIDTSPGGRMGRIPGFVLNIAQLQIFTEAHSCIFHNGDTDYFHTLRLMEAVLQSAPSALIQLYALLSWCDAPDGVPALLRLSVLASIVSVGLGLALWEQKVQVRASSAYVASVAVMRGFEIASRVLTLTNFAVSLGSPYPMLWTLAFDYTVMLILIIRHKSVQLTYGLFVALPLVLVSLEPLVWRREDHAVPKDSYYLVRIVELLGMWYAIYTYQQTGDFLQSGSCDISAAHIMAVFCTLGLFGMLPFVWRFARRHELSRDAVDWGEDGAGEGLQDGAFDGDDYSDSEGSEGQYADGRDHDDDMPGE